MINVLHISPNFNYSCGVSKYVFQLFNYYAGLSDYKLYFITNGGDGLEKLKEISINPHFMNFATGWRNIFNYKENKKFLLDFCRQNKIDIIHTHHRYPEILAYKISNKTPIKTVTTVHSLVRGLKSFSYKSGKIIAVSDSVKKNLIDNYHLDSNKIIRLYNCIEPFAQVALSSISEIKTRLGIPVNNRVLLFTGRVCFNKGSDILLSTFNLLEQEVKNITLLIIGSIEKEMNNILRSFNSENVLFISPQKYISDYYAVSDIVVLPSRQDPFPYTMLEAGLYKKAFIGGRTGGIMEFIEDDENGLLVDPGDRNKLFIAIKQLLEDNDLRIHLGNNLYKKVLPLTDTASYFNSISSIYQKLMSE